MVFERFTHTHCSSLICSPSLLSVCVCESLHAVSVNVFDRLHKNCLFKFCIQWIKAEDRLPTEQLKGHSLLKKQNVAQQKRVFVCKGKIVAVCVSVILLCALQAQTFKHALSSKEVLDNHGGNHPQALMGLLMLSRNEGQGISNADPALGGGAQGSGYADVVTLARIWRQWTCGWLVM